jgi:GT2 family glycosyltransferase
MEASDVLVSVIVIGYNGRPYLPRTLEALQGQTLCRRENVEIILVDNASVDGTVELARERYPDVRTIGLTENIGYYRAFERAAADARGRFVVVMPQDMLAHEEWLDELVGPALANPRVGVVVSSIINPGCRAYDQMQTSGRIDAYGKFFISSFGQVRYATGQDGRCELTLATIGPILFSRKLKEESGFYFDAGWSHYAGDWEAGLRAALLGYLPVWNPRSVVYHLGEEDKRQLDLGVLTRYGAGARDQLLVYYKLMSCGEFLVALPLLCAGLPAKAFELRTSVALRAALAVASVCVLPIVLVAAVLQRGSVEASRQAMEQRRRAPRGWLLRSLLFSPRMVHWEDGRSVSSD